MTTYYEAELREQPDVLQRLLTQGRERAEAIAAALRLRAPRFAVLAARGSSDNAARYGQYVLGIHNQLVAALATPSVFTHYGAKPSLEGALAIGISQSGQSPDIVAVLREARRQGAATLALTNDPRSPLAQTSEYVFPLLAGDERAVAATKTYGAELMALAMLSAALRGGGWQDLAALPQQVAQTIDLNRRCASEAKRFAAHNRLIVLGRGYNFSTALEVGLKIKETTGIMADGYSSADFLHGPKALADRALPLLTIQPGRAFEDLDGAVALAREKGSPHIAISDRDELLEGADLALPLAPGIPEWLSPLAAVVPGQLLALGLSLARGADPDAPPGLSKVTHTH